MTTCKCGVCKDSRKLQRILSKYKMSDNDSKWLIDLHTKLMCVKEDLAWFRAECIEAHQALEQTRKALENLEK